MSYSQPYGPMNGQMHTPMNGQMHTPMNGQMHTPSSTPIGSGMASIPMGVSTNADLDDNQERVLELRVLRPDGRAEQLVIRHARVLIGSGAHCDIRIDGTGAAREHVELQLQGEQLLARALCHSPPPVIGGAAFVAGALPSGAQIAVCGTRITVNILREQTKKSKSSAKKILTTLTAAVISFLLPAAVFAALKRPDDNMLAPPPAPTPLWAGQVTTCKFDAADQALHQAKLMRGAAEAGRERYPFAIEDGVAAVTSFESAAACFKVAGRQDEAARDTENADTLRPVLERDYLAHRVRLEHAIDTDDLLAAVTEVRTLRSLTKGLKGPYIDWLAVVDRRLEMNLKAAEKKK